MEINLSGHAVAFSEGANSSIQLPEKPASSLPLSEKELSILHKYIQGRTSKEISMEHDITITSLENIRLGIYSRLNVSTLVEACAIATKIILSEDSIQIEIPEHHNDPRYQLTKREVEILTNIATGKKSAEIANELGIKTKSVDNYRDRIQVKLQSTSAGHAVAIGLSNGIIDTDVISIPEFPEQSEQKLGLSVRQKELLLLKAQDKTAQEVAKITNISMKTVENHLSIVRKRYGVYTTHAALFRAIEEGDLSLTEVMEQVKTTINPQHVTLSPRQISILKQTAKDLTYVEIGNNLGLAKKTIENIAGSTMKSLGTKSAFGSIMTALKVGFIHIDEIIDTSKLDSQNNDEDAQLPVEADIFTASAA